MKKLIGFFIAVLCVAPIASANAAVTIKKASPVASSESAGSSGGAASLVPTVVGLVSGIIEMNAKQNALTAECIPSTTEMNFVDNTMKEWAKSGAMTADSFKGTLGREKCQNGPDCYRMDVQAVGSSGMGIHYNYFSGAGNTNMVWDGFPKTGIGTYCKNGMVTGCSGNDIATMSDTYDLFNQIGFGPADYLPSEATMAARLLNKVETCTTAKLSAKKRAMWGEFLVNTASGIGQKTNTGSIMDQVGAISASGGAGALGSLGSIATQFMMK